MENLSANVLKALSIYGSKLGLKRFTIEKNDQWNRGILTFDMTGSYYFSLTSEVSCYEDKKSKYRHCVPSKGGFFDYSVKKSFPDLESWYLDAKNDIPQQGEIPWTEGIVYGIRHRLYTRAIPLSELATLLEPLLSVALYEPKPDSFDMIVPLLPNNVISMQRRKADGFYIDPVSGKYVKFYILDNKKMKYNWTPKDPHWIVRHMPSLWALQDPIFREAATLSEMGVTANEVFLSQIHNYSHTFERLSDLI